MHVKNLNYKNPTTKYPRLVAQTLVPEPIKSVCTEMHCSPPAPSDTLILGFRFGILDFFEIEMTEWMSYWGNFSFTICFQMILDLVFRDDFLIKIYCQKQIDPNFLIS